MASISISGLVNVKLAASQSRNGASSYSRLRNFAAMSRAWARWTLCADSSVQFRPRWGAFRRRSARPRQRSTQRTRDGFERSAPDEIDRANALQRRENDDVASWPLVPRVSLMIRDIPSERDSATTRPMAGCNAWRNLSAV